LNETAIMFLVLPEYDILPFMAGHYPEFMEILP
jgi:hypothetical protein